MAVKYQSGYYHLTFSRPANAFTMLKLGVKHQSINQSIIQLIGI